jgi:hypothetical protein
VDIHLNSLVDTHLNNLVDTRNIHLKLVCFWIELFININDNSGGGYGQNQLPFQPPPVLPRPNLPKG